MDMIDRQILLFLSQNARMPVKEIAQKVSLTSPAVSGRIRKMEEEGIIAGYTLVLSPDSEKNKIHALISLSMLPSDKDTFLELIQKLPAVQQCDHVTGSHSYNVKVCCSDMSELEHLINQFQKFGQTSTQIILSTLLDRKIPLI